MRGPLVRTLISGVIGLVIGMVVMYAMSRWVASATYIPLGAAMTQIKNQLASPSLNILDKTL